MTADYETARRPLRRDPIVAAGIAVILLVQAIVLWRAAPRAIDHDEGEHLRAAAWMASGKTLYRDFAENHTPFLYMILEPIAPAASDDVAATRHYTIIARVLSAVAGVAAVVCIAAIVFHLTGDAMSILIVLASLLATSWTWLRGVADVRSEPYTLLLFWAGALLVVRALSRRAVLTAGIGIGLIAVADLWNPKWPLESLVLLAVYAALCGAAALGGQRPQGRVVVDDHGLTADGRRGRRPYTRIAASVAIPVAMPLLALCIALRVTTLRDLIFFSYTYASAVSRWYRGAAVATSAGAFGFAPLWLMPWGALLAAVIVIWRRRNILLVLPLLIAAAAEVFFLYPYPHLFPQYLVMWACVTALLYGVAIGGLSERTPVRATVAATIVIAFVAHEWTHLTQPANERHWRTMADLQRRLGAGEAAWVRPEELPVKAAAGSYYWYAFADQVPFSLAYGRTPAAKGFLPPLGDDDLPPCRILRGIDTMHVRLLDSRAVEKLPESKRCMEALAQRGSIRRVSAWVWEVAR